MNALEMLRLREQTHAVDSKAYEAHVARLLDAGIEEAIQLGRPWVAILAPIWCLDALHKEADSRGFNFREAQDLPHFQIREVMMLVKPEVRKQHDYELSVKEGKV